MNKSKRKLPLGWRRLTPTEKITEECKMATPNNLINYPEDALNIDDTLWNTSLALNYKGQTNKQVSPFIVIKPIKSKAIDTNITPH